MRRASSWSTQAWKKPAQGIRSAREPKAETASTGPDAYTCRYASFAQTPETVPGQRSLIVPGPCIDLHNSSPLQPVTDLIEQPLGDTKPTVVGVNRDRRFAACHTRVQYSNDLITGGSHQLKTCSAPRLGRGDVVVVIRVKKGEDAAAQPKRLISPGCSRARSTSSCRASFLVPHSVMPRSAYHSGPRHCRVVGV